MIGQRFGRLVVQSEAEQRYSKRRWLCMCDCGTPHTVYAFNLKSGHTQSCGCIPRRLVVNRATPCSCGEKRPDRFAPNAANCLSCSRLAESHPSLWKRPEVSHA